jgi:hypothetical protein
MRIAKLLLNAAALSGLSLVSIVCGFWAWQLLGGASQLAVQVPITLACGAAGMVGWLKCLRRVHQLNPSTDYLPVILLALPVCALLLAGGHYLVTGYPTAFGNIAGTWLVFLAEAGMAVPIAASIRLPAAASRSRSDVS